MKKKIFYFFIFIITVLIIFLNFKGPRYTGVDYLVYKEKISNFQKIKEFYIRYYNYKQLVKKITYNVEKEKDEIIKISEWIYFNINKKSNKEVTIDSHPWTIVERQIGVKDQFSDILSVLLVINKIESFFIAKIIEYKESDPLTFFKYNDKWSIIDPYYGIYFINNQKEFCSIEEHKKNKCAFIHLKYGKISDDKISEIFFDKDFKNYNDLNSHYNLIFRSIPTTEDIENTNIYLRGGRSYVQTPIHRLVYQIQKYLNLI